MKIRPSNKFVAVSILLFLIIAISSLSFSKAVIKKEDSCKRIDKAEQKLFKSFVNTKCQACHAN